MNRITLEEKLSRLEREVRLGSVFPPFAEQFLQILERTFREFDPESA